MDFLRNLWNTFRQRYEHSQRKEIQEVNAWRTRYVQHAVERLEQDLSELEESIEDNPYNLEALALFSEAESETLNREEQEALYRSHVKTHQYLLINLAHYPTSVPASLLQEYFTHWKRLESLRQRQDASES